MIMDSHDRVLIVVDMKVYDYDMAVCDGDSYDSVFIYV